MVATLVLDAGPSLAAWAQQTKRSELQRMLALASGPGILSLALGLPAPELFPVAEVEQAAASVLANETRALQYGPPLQTLKTHIVELMSQRGVECRESQVFLTTGAQQGLNILSRLLLDPGGQVLTEELCYPGFRQAIESYQPEILTVPTDLETGMDVDEVEWLLTNGAKPAFIYVITDGHNPLAVSLSREKRQRLVRLARDFRVPLVEDDPYGLLEYEGKIEPPLRALAADWVFYVGSFSKILAPALRVGWIIAPESLMPTLSIIKEASDIDTSTFGQRITSAYLDAGHLPAHLERLRTEYRSRRDSMLRALNEHFPVQARWRKPSSGVFTWVDLPKKLDVGELLRLSIEE
ncbi:MAG TPA: PLP-dependent aminotransferase family protein, partial [Pyrinomonadaceae bacterium]|nr:PLP-dependent aminotransferase family protein [Pyrinomonadaceae bacterium]